MLHKLVLGCNGGPINSRMGEVCNVFRNPTVQNKTAEDLLKCSQINPKPNPKLELSKESQNKYLISLIDRYFQRST